MEEHEFNLNIPRYVDTFEEEEEVDLQAVQQRIEELENELTEVQGQMAKRTGLVTATLVAADNTRRLKSPVQRQKKGKDEKK